MLKFSLPLLLLLLPSSFSSSTPDPLFCDYALIGGGSAALRLASRLSSYLASADETVCIFEREERLGGRILDVHLGEGLVDEEGRNRGEGIEIIGLGGWRYDVDHERVAKIVAEHDIPTYDWLRVEGPIEARGQFAPTPFSLLLSAFPSIDSSHPLYQTFKSFEGSEQNKIFSRVFMMMGELLMKHIENGGSKFIDLQTLVREEWGNEAFELLKASLEGYRGLWTSSWDFPKFVFEDAENGSGVYKRPLGGMTDVLKALEKDIERNSNGRVKIFLGTKVTGVWDAEPLLDQLSSPQLVFSSSNTTVSSSQYHLTLTSPHASSPSSVLTRTPIFSLPPLHMSRIQGLIPQILLSLPSPLAYEETMPSFKAAALYPYAWWEEAGFGFVTKDGEKKDGLGGWEIMSSDSTCLGGITPKQGRGPNGEAGLHISYSDGTCCSPSGHWANAIATLNSSELYADIQKQLQYIFKNVSIPEPLDFVYAHWDAAYHLPRIGNPKTMREGQDWAVSPKNLRGRGEEEIYVIGEAVSMGRGWVEGAFESADLLADRLIERIESRVGVKN